MKKNILLIDDSMTIHRVIDLSIDDEKYHVEKVFTIEDADAKLKNFKPDVILLDNKLEGIKLEEYVRKLKESCNAAVILLVGAFDEFTEKNLKNFNADDFIVKPFNSNLLDEKLSKVLSVTTESGSPLETHQTAEPKDEAVEELLASIETEKSFEESTTFDIGELYTEEKELETEESFQKSDKEEEIDEDILSDFFNEEGRDETLDESIKGDKEETVSVEDIFGELKEVDENEVEDSDTFQTESIEDLEEKNIGSIEELSEKMFEKEKPYEISKEMIREIVYEAIDIDFLKEIVRDTVSKSLEKAVWEIVPELAEKLILEEIERIKKGQ
jgi:DNA-binding response OmpR family regulator